MNALRNKVQLIGNLGMNPQVKEFDGGKKLVKFSLATNESYKNNEGKRISETQWHSMIAWGNTATYVEKFLKQGMQVAIDGKLINRIYTDKQGIKRFLTEIQINEVMIVND